MASWLRQGKKWMRRTREMWFRDFVFIHINKTGGSSIEKALGVRFDHQTALEKRRQLGEQRWKKRFKFAFVRNPWDKVVSQYAYRRGTNKTGLGEAPMPFREWVFRTYGEQDPLYYDTPRMFMPQWKWITDEHGRILLDFIGRFENLTGDFDSVRSRLGRGAKLPHRKKSDRADFRAYYDNATRDLIGEWFYEDIQQFGYAFENVSFSENHDLG